jgi:SP family general alpha glucoside:H+ symporter-like MFS transporter
MSDSKGLGADMETKGHETQIEHVYDSDEKTRAANMKADAIDAENVELNLGVIAAIKAYPMAATWAFVISCTIVSCESLSKTKETLLMLDIRSWRLTACF